jgi:hypothetical protein
MDTEKKIIIGIELDEIIRAKFQEFDKYYANEFGDELADQGKFTLDYWEDFHWEDVNETINYLNEDLPENISPLEYQINPETGEAPVDHMAFRKRKEFKKAIDVYKQFLYQDYLLEIFGNAQKIYRNVDVDVESFYTKYRDFADIRIICKENWFTIPPTLFFLSKVRPRFKHYHFMENEIEMWDIADIMITTDPKVIAAKPKDSTNKTAIMVKRPYNFNVELDTVSLDNESKENISFSVMNVVDLINNKDFEKLIGYVKTEENEKIEQ